MRLTNGEQAYSEMSAVGVIFLLSLASFFFVLPLALQGMRRISRFRERLRTGESVFSIWHPNDEAIAFLQSIERVPLTAFPKSALLRGSRTPAILWSVRLVLAIVTLCTLVVAGNALVLFLASRHVLAEDSPLVRGAVLDNTMSLTVIELGVGGALVFFSLFYLLIRLLFGLAPELLLRARLNGWIGWCVAWRSAATPISASTMWLRPLTRIPRASACSMANWPSGCGPRPRRPRQR
jgi:hypothetical protein